MTYKQNLMFSPLHNIQLINRSSLLPLSDFKNSLSTSKLSQSASQYDVLSLN